MKNEFEIRGDVTAIILKSQKYGDMETLISTSKLEMVSQFPHSWTPYFNKNTQSFYVQGHAIKSTGKYRKLRLHRWIMDAPQGMVVDHKNHDTLDNTTSNLRTCKKRENSQNMKMNKKNSSGVRGVIWDKVSRKWRVQFRLNYKSVYRGLFNSIEEAEKAVKAARKELMPYSVG